MRIVYVFTSYCLVWKLSRMERLPALHDQSSLVIPFSSLHRQGHTIAVKLVPGADTVMRHGLN